METSTPSENTSSRQSNFSKIFDTASAIIPLYGSLDTRLTIQKLTKFYDEPLVRSLIVTIFKRLVDLDYVVIIRGQYSTTDKGRAVIESGGHNKYLELTAKQKIDIKIKEEAELENLYSTTKINKWLYHTRWLPHILASLAFVISVIALIYAIMTYYSF